MKEELLKVADCKFFSVKDQIVKILGFADPRVSIATSNLLLATIL